MPSSNRLLDLFRSEIQNVSPSSVGRAPSHGASNAISVKLDYLPRVTKGRAGCGNVHGIGVGETARAFAAGGTRPRVETKLERENAHLREQLKFQGAVLDQLAGDVHTLELKAAAGASGATHLRPSSIHNQEAKDAREGPNKGMSQGQKDEAHQENHEAGARCPDICDGGSQGRRVDGEVAHGEHCGVDDGDSFSSSLYNQNGTHTADDLVQGDRGNTPPTSTQHERDESARDPHQKPDFPLETSSNHCVLRKALLTRSSPTTGEKGSGDNITDLRSELRAARLLTERIRGDFAAAQKAAEEKEQSHVGLLSRERKFRATVEAGLREKVHSMRRRARDREERLSAELSSVKAQLKEAVDLLATKEDEVRSMRARNAEQEDRASAALARGTERDRQMSWLERRLEEVSSGEASAAALRLEEMTAALEAQQQELERLRASTREAERCHNHHHQRRRRRIQQHQTRTTTRKESGQNQENLKMRRECAGRGSSADDHGHEKSGANTSFGDDIQTTDAILRHDDGNDTLGGGKRDDRLLARSRVVPHYDHHESKARGHEDDDSGGANVPRVSLDLEALL
ncbi:unnamed protein product [Ectocarpus fasciculatus]